MIRTESHTHREPNVSFLPDVMLVRSPKTEKKFAHGILSNIPFYSVEEFLVHVNEQKELLSRYMSIADLTDFVQKQAQGYEGVVFRLSLGAPNLMFKLYFDTQYGLFLIEELLTYVQGLTDDAKERILAWAIHQHHSNGSYGKKSYVLRQAAAFQVANKLNSTFAPSVTGILNFSGVLVGHVTPYLPGEAMFFYDLEFDDWADEKLKAEFLAYVELLKKRKIRLDYNSDSKNAIVQRNAEGKITDVKLIDMEKMD
jgi:hypothetical protein